MINTRSNFEEVPGIDGFERKMLEKLEASKIIEHVYIGDALPDADINTLISLTKKPLKMKVTSAGLVYTDEDNQEILCPDYGMNISADGMWLSDKIPNVNFDIEQNGNLRRAEEAQSAYCCVIVSLVLGDEGMTKELHDLIKNYNFNEMSPRSGGILFKSLLEDWQSLQSVSINIAISAAKFKISNLKKESGKYLKDGIDEKAAAELQSLSDAIREVNRRFSMGKLSQENVKDLTKIQILRLLDERDDEISKIISVSNQQVLYKILNLSSEYLSPIVKRNVYKRASESVEELYAQNPDYAILVGDKQTIIDRWKRRYIKLAKISLRKTEVEKYLKDKSTYILPRKL